MSGLAEQRLIIDRLEQATAIHRVRLIEACRTFNPPVDTVTVAAGTALIVADLAPGIGAVAGLFFGDGRPGDRGNRLLKVILEAPILVRTVRRLLPDRQRTP